MRFRKEKPDYNCRQYGFYTTDQLVLKDCFLRQVDLMINFDFIYDLVEDTYRPTTGRPNLNSILLVKIPLIQCFCSIRFMRPIIKEMEVNLAYRWFLDFTLDDKVPHFITYRKNDGRCFRDKKLISEVFARLLHQALCAGLIEPIELRPAKVIESIRVIPKYVSPVPYYLFVQKVKTSKT